MARSRKKKWKSRIKKALKLAAIGGAGYLAAKRFGGKKKFGTDAGFLKSGAAGGASLATPKTDWITKKTDTAPVDNVAAESKPIIPMGAGHPIIRGNKQRYEAAIAAANTPGHGTAAGPPSELNPYRAPRQKLRTFKSGGSVKKARVTGAAKRGFGRALMKGKK